MGGDLFCTPFLSKLERSRCILALANFSCIMAYVFLYSSSIIHTVH